MAKDIYVNNSEIPSNSIKQAEDYMNTALRTIREFDQSPIYCSSEGYSNLYTVDVMDEVAILTSKIAEVSNKLERYYHILNVGPEQLVEIDYRYKNGVPSGSNPQGYLSSGFEPTKLGTLGMLTGLFCSNKNKTSADTTVNLSALNGGGGALSGGGGGSRGANNPAYYANLYSAGGGGYSKLAGGGGAFGGSGDIEKGESSGNYLVDSWNDFTYGYGVVKDKYNNLDDSEKKAIKKISEAVLGEDVNNAVEIADDIVTGDVSWDTAEKALEAMKVESTTVNVIIKTCETVINPTGNMKTLMDGKDLYMDQAVKKLSNGDIAGGLSDLGNSAACGLSAIAYGVGEVSTELVAEAVDGVAKKITAPLDKVSKIIPGKAGNAVKSITSGIKTVTGAVSGFLKKLL